MTDTGNQNTTPAPGGLSEGWAKSHSLGVGEETGRAVMDAHREFSYPWTPFGSGPEGPGPGSGCLRGRWHQRRVRGKAGSGHSAALLVSDKAPKAPVSNRIKNIIHRSKLSVSPRLSNWHRSPAGQAAHAEN